MGTLDDRATMMGKQPLRIVHLIPGLTVERGGPTTVIVGLTTAQAAAGHRVAVVTTDQGLRQGETAAVLSEGIEQHTVSITGTDRAAYAPHLPALLRQLLPTADVVHVHSIFTYPVDVGLRVAKHLHKPVILRPCGQLHPRALQSSATIKRAYLVLRGRHLRQSVTRWHYTSTTEALESWPGPKAPYFVLPNGVSSLQSTMTRTDARAMVAARWPALANEPFALFLGRLHPKKKLDFLLEVFATGDFPHARLVIAGPDEANLWPALAQRWQVAIAAGRVVRVGVVSGADKQALLTAARVFVLPSEHENFGVAALEALQVGTPALLSPHVDLAASAVVAGFAQALPLELAAWRAALPTAFLKEEITTEAMRSHCRQWVLENFAWSALALRLEAEYRSALEAKACLGKESSR